jgi:hypothetical protein
MNPLLRRSRLNPWLYLFYPACVYADLPAFMLNNHKGGLVDAGTIY